MTPVTSSSALSVLLALARKHSADLRSHSSALQNIAALSNSSHKKYQRQKYVTSMMMPTALSSTSASVSSPQVVIHSSRAMTTSSKRVVASLSLWQSQRGRRENMGTVLRDSPSLATIPSRLLSTCAGPFEQKHYPSGYNMPQIETPEGDALISDVPKTFKGLDPNFPCVTRVKNSGPEPEYDNIKQGFKLFTSEQPFHLKFNDGVLPQLEIAYETWGHLNENASNAVIVLAGLSASSHARSSIDNMKPGWWEKFIGPGCAVDTNKFFVICPNNLGGCYGSSGPSSINILTGEPYATTFPIIGVEDMTRAIFLLLDHLGIHKLYGAVGSSLGGMLSLQSAVTFPERVGKLVTISSTAQSHPSSIAMRYLQRKCIMCDPNWNNGYYYGKTFPKVGMKLAREIATITYRSGPEWSERFGRDRLSDDGPSLCPTFLIESYLEHQGESFSTKYDPNSLLYISKAMDLFDISEGYNSLEEGVARVTCPVMVIGVQTDVLFPIWQQRELAEALQHAGNEQVTFYELNSLYGHDTFLLDLNGVGAAVKGFLETEQRQTGWLTKHKRRRHNEDRKLF